MNSQEQSTFSPRALLVRATETVLWESHNDSERWRKHCAVLGGPRGLWEDAPYHQFWARTLEDDSLVVERRKDRDLERLWSAALGLSCLPQ